SLGRPGLFFGRLFASFEGIHPYGGAQLTLPDHDEIVLGVVCRPIPFGTADSAGAEMHALLWRERYVNVLDRPDRNPIEHLLRVEVEAVEMAVLGCNKHDPLAGGGRHYCGRTGHVPIVPILGNDLEMLLVGAGARIEDNDRVGVEIAAAPHCGLKVGRWIATRDKEQPRIGIERIGGPSSAPRDWLAARHVPT